MITAVVNDELLRLTFAMIVVYRKTSYIIDGNGCSIHLSFSVVNEWLTAVYDRACLTWALNPSTQQQQPFNLPTQLHQTFDLPSHQPAFNLQGQQQDEINTNTNIEKLISLMFTFLQNQDKINEKQDVMIKSLYDLSNRFIPCVERIEQTTCTNQRTP
jgi:hypothetical protein